MLVYTHINHVLLDSPAGEGPFAVGRPSRVGPVGRGARPARPPGPTFGCRTPRARGGPPRMSAPTTHPAPTRPGARRTRAALGAGRQEVCVWGGGRAQASLKTFLRVPARSVLTIQEGDMTGENCSRRETVCGKSACA